MVGNEVDGPFFWCMPWEMWPDLMHFTHQKKLWSPESQFDIIGPIGEICAKLVHFDIVEPQNIFFCNLKSLKFASGHISHDIN